MNPFYVCTFAEGNHYWGNPYNLCLHVTVFCKNKNSSKQTRGKVHYHSAFPDGQLRGNWIHWIYIIMAEWWLIEMQQKLMSGKWWWSGKKISGEHIWTLWDFWHAYPSIKAKLKAGDFKKSLGSYLKFKMPQQKWVSFYWCVRSPAPVVDVQPKSLLIKWLWDLVKDLKSVVQFP